MAARDPRSENYDGSLESVAPPVPEEAPPSSSGKGKGSYKGGKGGKGGKGKGLRKGGRHLEEARPRKANHKLCTYIRLDGSEGAGAGEVSSLLRSTNLLVEEVLGVGQYSLTRVEKEAATAAKQYIQRCTVPASVTPFSKCVWDRAGFLRATVGQVMKQFHHSYCNAEWAGQPEAPPANTPLFRAVGGTCTYFHPMSSGQYLCSGAQVSADQVHTALGNMDIDSRFTPDIRFGPQEDRLQARLALLEGRGEIVRSDRGPRSVHQFKSMPIPGNGQCDVELEEDASAPRGFRIASITKVLLKGKSGSLMTVDCDSMEGGAVAGGDDAEPAPEASFPWSFRLRCGKNTDITGKPEAAATLDGFEMKGGTLHAPALVSMSASCYRLKDQAPTEEHPCLGTYTCGSATLSVSRVTQLEMGRSASSFLYAESTCPAVSEAVLGIHGTPEEDLHEKSLQIAGKVAQYLADLSYALGWWGEGGAAAAPLSEAEVSGAVSDFEAHLKKLQRIQTAAASCGQLFAEEVEEAEAEAEAPAARADAGGVEGAAPEVGGGEEEGVAGGVAPAPVVQESAVQVQEGVPAEACLGGEAQAMSPEHPAPAATPEEA